jgi:hypothetical protein
MKVLIGVFLGAALVITLAVTVLTDVKLWGLVRESGKSFRRLPPERRRRAVIWLAATYALVLGEGAVVVIAPFGVGTTLTWFVIIPLLVIVFVAIIAAGIRGFRGQRRARPPDT